MGRNKFRAWDTVDKKWLFGYELLGGFSLIGEVVLMGELNRVPLDRWQHIVIEQWTGLKDKNQTPIYGGDIVRWWGDHTGTVVWDSYRWNVDQYWCGSHDTPGDAFSEGTVFEVIGNIHEPPNR